MTTFIVLYRGSTLVDAELVAASSDPELVAYAASRMLDGRLRDAPTDPILGAREQGRRRALRLVRKEAQAAAAEGAVPELEGA